MVFRHGRSCLRARQTAFSWSSIGSLARAEHISRGTCTGLLSGGFLALALYGSEGFDTLRRRWSWLDSSGEWCAKTASRVDGRRYRKAKLDSWAKVLAGLARQY